MSLSLPVKSVMMREEMAKRTVSGCRSKTDGVLTKGLYNPKANGQKRIALIDKYANSYVDLDELTTDEMVAESMKIHDTQFKLVKKFTKKIKKVSGSKAAAQFYQLELFIQDATGVALMEQIPFIGEFDL